GESTATVMTDCRTRFIDAASLLREMFGLWARSMIGDSLPRRKRAAPPSVQRGPKIHPQGYSVPLNSSRFGVPLTFPVIMPAVELGMTPFGTEADDGSPKVALSTSLTPTTCGVAIDVPLKVIVVAR